MASVWKCARIFLFLLIGTAVIFLMSGPATEFIYIDF